MWDALVELRDVMPTLLDLLGIEPESHFEGRSLAGMLGSGASTGDGGANTQGGESHSGGEAHPGGGARCLLPYDLAYAEALLYGGEQKSLTAYPWKLVYAMQEQETSLFNLEDDLGEQHGNKNEQRQGVEDPGHVNIGLLEAKNGKKQGNGKGSAH